MAFFRLAIISSLCCALLVIGEGPNEKQENADKSAIIQSALNYLNSNPVTVFHYRKGTLLKAENKGDILEVYIEVDVDCNNRYPDVSCNEHTLNCHAFMGRNPAAIYEVLSDVKCSPKIEITVEDYSDSKTIPFVSATPNIGNDKLDLSNEALPPGQGNADFVAIRKDNIPCLGCPFDLNTDAEGVNELIDTTVRHIESERNQRHRITKIRRLQQQVVAGIKYILLADVAATTCSKDADISAPCILDSSAEPLTCEVTFIQKPWIDKGKHIIKNNCTLSQEFEPLSHSRSDRDELSNDILPHKDLDIAAPDIQPKPNTPNYDAMAQNGNIDEPIDADRLADLESQILVGGTLEEAPTKTKTGTNFAAPQFVQREPTLVTENFDHLSVEPLNSEQPSQLTTLYASMPAVEETNPILVMYAPQNTDNYLPNIRTTMGSFGGYNSYWPPRFARELDSQSSESDSKSSEEKVVGTQKIATAGKTDEEKSSSVKPDLEPTTTTTEDVEVTTTINTEIVRKKRNIDSNSQQSEEIKEHDNSSVGSEENDDISTSRESKRAKRSNSSSDSSDESQKKSKSSKSDSDDDDGSNCTKKKDHDSDSSESKEHHKKHRKSEKSSDPDDDSEESTRKHSKKRDSSSSSESDENSGSSEKHHKKHTKCSRAESDENKNCSSEKKMHDRSGEHDDDDHCKNSLPKCTKDIITTAKQNKTEHDDNNGINEEDNGDSTARPARATPEALRRKRSIGQMEKISPDEKVIVRDLADFAAATLDNIDDDHHKRVILQILGAKKLKLDGTYYQIILRLGISHCHENEYHENCREKLFTNQTKICKVQVFVEDDFSNPKVVKSQCQNIKKDADDRNRTNYSRYRRSLLVGGHSPIAANDPDVQKFLGATLKHLDSVSETPNKHTTVEVLSATSQIVAGVRYVIKAKIGLLDCGESKENQQGSCELLADSEPEICTIDVWDRPWLNKTVYKVECDDKKTTETKKYSFGDEEEEEKEHSRKKRGIPGGVNSLPESKIQDYLQKCLTHLDSTSAESNKYISEKVLKATTQVVAGTLVRISAQVTVSNCPKSSDNLKDCAKLEGSPSILCKFEIWEKPWMNFKETSVKCEDRPKEVFRSKREIGGWERPEISESESVHKPNETKATIIVWKALDYLSAKTQPGKILRLMNLTHTHHLQALDSEFWKIEAEVALCQQTKLMPSIHFTLTRCPPYSEHFKCQFVARKNSYSLLDDMKVNITCDNDKESYIYDPIKKSEDDALGAMFTEFAVKYKKAYKDEAEYNYRLKIFRDNLNKIALLNKYEKGTGRYGITSFADMSEKEFSISHGLRPDLRNSNELPFARAKIPDVKLPVEFDWREKGAVTEVKNQGLCGSCWAFSVTGNVEGQYAISHGKLLEFSEQELVDCDKVDEGCNGGLMDNAYRVIEKLGGLETESDYPYEGDDEKCHFDAAKVEVKLTGALNISHDETDMAKWLLQNGPISIAINANAMQFYVGGVSHPWKMLCNPNSLDHGVLIVGFGEHHYSLFNRTLPYWIVKNSWGPSWGEQGYYRVYRGDGTCGLNQTPSSAIVE